MLNIRKDSRDINNFEPIEQAIQIALSHNQPVLILTREERIENVLKDNAMNLINDYLREKYHLNITVNLKRREIYNNNVLMFELIAVPRFSKGEQA